MLLIWYLDLATTLIGLSIGLTEGNPRADYLVNLGAIGWAYWFVIGTFMIIFLALLIYKVSNYIIKKNKKKNKKTSKIRIYLPMSVFIITEAVVIIRNIYYIILQL